MPLTVVGTAPSLKGAALLAGATTLQVQFSQAVVGKSSDNYQLQSLGPDALLGTADDTIVSVSASCTGATATLSFAPLHPSLYRLNVKDSILDASGNKLDGDANGTSGGNWVRDFAVNEMPAALDPSFAGDGKVTTLVGWYTNAARGVAVQADGKVLVAGYGYGKYSDADFALVRYLADGRLDTSFGTDGIVTTSFGAYDYGWSVAVQPDGKILVAGVSGDDTALARYTSDGVLDASFADGGRLTTRFGPLSSGGSSVVVQSDGKILVGGYLFSSSGGVFAVIRYNADGTLDTTFGSHGEVAGPNGFGYSLALQSDGRILVAGDAPGRYGDQSRAAVVRYNSDGTLDTTFAGDGELIIGFGTMYDHASDVAVQPDGKIVVAGSSYRTPEDVNGVFAVARCNADGTMDTSFGDDGTVLGPPGSGRSVALQPDGKIVVAGWSRDSRDLGVFTVLRLNADGSPTASAHSGQFRLAR